MEGSRGEWRGVEESGRKYMRVGGGGGSREEWRGVEEGGGE